MGLSMTIVLGAAETDVGTDSGLGSGGEPAWSRLGGAEIACDCGRRATAARSRFRPRGAASGSERCCRSESSAVRSYRLIRRTR